jgi:thiol-disulfide isomerase/thioredoxin
VTAVTLYSRPGCHLCDDMKAVVERVARHVPLTVSVVDISSDQQLEALYGLEIPVLLVDGRKVAKYRVAEEQLLRAVGAGKAGRAGGPG